MQDDEADKARAETAPSFQFVALSLRDGLDAEQVYHQSSGLDLSNPQSLRVRFLRALRTGQIDGTGYLPPRLPESLPVLIPDNAWDQCQIEWESGELHGAGFHFVDVRILMSVGVFDRHHLFYLHQPVTALAPFAPSDDKREMLGIHAETIPANLNIAPQADSATVPQRKGGRPSLKEHIVAAFSAIEKDLNWTDKQLAAAIRQHVKDALSKQDDKGLGDDAIFKYVRPLWHAFRKRPD